MARNRRSTRRRPIKEYLNMKTFLTIVGVLLVIIVIELGIHACKNYEDKQLLARQKDELSKQSEQIFAELENNISQTNQNISEADEIIKMSAVGDILCSESMIEDAYNAETNTYNFSHMFAGVSGFIDNADIVMGTMETNFTSGKYTSENTPKEFAQAVKNSGINVVTISHNHSLDYGSTGLRDTKKLLKELGYNTVGDKIDDENAVLIKTVKNTKIAFLTYTYGVNYQSSKSKDDLKLVNMYSENQVKSDIKYAKKQGAKYICVMIHWGDAISDKVTDEQKKMADFMVENGVDMILGAHPSVVQPMEVRKNKDGKNVFIAYSIGTYISTLYDENAKTELVLNIELRKDGKDGSISLYKVDYTPIYVLDRGKDAQNRYELIDMKSAANNYTSGNPYGIDRETYDKLIQGLKKLSNSSNGLK